MEELKLKHTPTILDFEAGLDSYEQAKEALMRWECHAELLEALKNIIADDEMRDGDLPQELVNMAKAVIFKAEGRS